MPERAGHGTAPRDPTDYYATTPDLAALICRAVRRDFAPEESAAAILEPGCGAGSFLAAIRDTWPAAAVRGVEIHADLADYSRARGFNVDLADLLRTRLGTFDLIVGNPPFRYADDFIPLLLRHLRPGGTLALVLRLNFLAGQERYGRLWAERPPAHVYALPARPGFTPDGKTDATDYCVVVWRDGYRGRTTFGWLDNRGMANKWTDPRSYPDPRRTARPDRATVGPGASLADWESGQTRTVPA